ncbi:MAG: calcium/sodium antiporter [Pseudomonadota bacterium]
MIYDITLIVSGLVLLVIAGDALVRGAVALSLKIGISALVVSLTVVAFGTSAPELLVGIKATLEGSPGLVFGNVVGSNIANVLLVLGVPLLIAPIATGAHGTSRNLALMLAASGLFIAISGTGGITFWIGVAFVGLLLALIYDAYVVGLKDLSDVDLSDVDKDAVGDPNWKIALLLLGGIVGLPLGANLLVDGASRIAFDLGMSEAAVGLTIVAIGTSLPELATTVAAAFRRQAEVAVGNVIGSNMFNILAVMGGSALFGDLLTPEGFMELDFWIMLATSLALAPFIFLKAEMTRATGILFLVAYAVYIVFALGPRM